MERAVGEGDLAAVVDAGAVAGEGDASGYVDVGGIADAFAGEEIVADVESAVVDQLPVENAGVVGEGAIVSEKPAEDAVVESDAALDIDGEVGAVQFALVEDPCASDGVDAGEAQFSAARFGDRAGADDRAGESEIGAAVDGHGAAEINLVGDNARADGFERAAVKNRRAAAHCLIVGEHQSALIECERHDVGSAKLK